MTPLDLEAIPTVGQGARRVKDDPEGNPLLDKLRRQHEAVKADRTNDFDVPGYGGLLVARYRKLSGAEMDEIAADADDLLAYNLAFLVEAVEGVFGREKDGTLTLIDTVGFGMDLADVLGITAESATECVSAVFDGHDLTIRAHGDDVANWMVRGKNELGK